MSAIWSLAAGDFDNPSRRSAEVCGSSIPDENSKCFKRAQSMWQKIQNNANEFYEPGKFTTFAGFEWTAGFKRVGMLHRNVIFRGGRLPDTIYSAVDFNNSPERLWQWLEKACTGDCQVLAIPHNTNFGWGRDLDTKNSDGTPFTTEGLTRRARTEPLIEIYQSKGNSECSPGLGTNDEQCNFEDVSLLIQKQGHHVSVDAPEDLPPVMADTQLLSQVVMNLVSNAVKYTPPGGEIAIRMSQKDRRVEWSVEDSGIGIPKASQARLFEKFFRAENVHKVETEGTGLGLCLVRLILERSGGRIWCESEENKGSTFFFTLPPGTLAAVANDPGAAVTAGSVTNLG